MTLQMTPPTNTKLITRYLSSDETLFEDIEKMLKVGGSQFTVGTGQREVHNGKFTAV